MNTGSNLEELYKSSFKGPFPYRDCFFLADQLGLAREDLIPELDLFFAQIAGYSSSASSLAKRKPSELATARSVLSKQFFQRFPQLEVYESHINQIETPDLFRYMLVAEELRIGLLDILNLISES